MVECGGLIFFECDLTQPLPECPPSHGFITREASIADLPLLDVTENPDHCRQAARERLERGDRWFVGIDSETGELANSRWISTSPSYIPEVDRELVLEPNEVYLYDIYTNPRFTSQGVNAMVRHTLYTYLQQSGIETIYACVPASNQASLRVARNLLKPIGRLLYLKFYGRGIVVGDVYLSFRRRESDSCAIRVLDSRSRSAANSVVVGGTLSSRASDTRSGHAVAARISSTEM